jgi:hypothetical protein
MTSGNSFSFFVIFFFSVVVSSTSSAVPDFSPFSKDDMNPRRVNQAAFQVA